MASSPSGVHDPGRSRLLRLIAIPLALWFLICVPFAVIDLAVRMYISPRQTVSLFQLAQDIKTRQVARLSVAGNGMTATYIDGHREQADLPNADISIPELMSAYGVPTEEVERIEIVYVKPPLVDNLVALVETCIPLVFCTFVPLLGLGGLAWLFVKTKKH